MRISYCLKLIHRSLEKTSILGINTDPEVLREISRLTGIQVVTELGVQVHATYQKCKEASFEAVHEGITAKCNRLYTSKIDVSQKANYQKCGNPLIQPHIYVLRTMRDSV